MVAYKKLGNTLGLTLFTANMTFSLKMSFVTESMSFDINKERRKILLGTSLCKYAFSDVYPRGSTAVNMLSILNMFDSKGGRARPIIGIIGIGIGISVFFRKSVSVSVCYSFLKIGIGIGKVKSPKNRLKSVSV